MSMKITKAGFVNFGYLTCQECGLATTVSTSAGCQNCGKVICITCSLEKLVDGYCDECRKAAAKLGFYDENQLRKELEV